jgi:hypothetical protein
MKDRRYGACFEAGLEILELGLDFGILVAGEEKDKLLHYLNNINLTLSDFTYFTRPG